MKNVGNFQNSHLSQLDVPRSQEISIMILPTWYAPHPDNRHEPLSKVHYIESWYTLEKKF